MNIKIVLAKMLAEKLTTYFDCNIIIDDQNRAVVSLWAQIDNSGDQLLLAHVGEEYIDFPRLFYKYDINNPEFDPERFSEVIASDIIKLDLKLSFPMLFSRRRTNQ